MENITHLELSGSTFEGLIDKGDTMIEAGRGSLYEVNLCRRTCSAKRLSDVLQEVKGESALTDEEVATVAQRFRLECVSLSKLRHPNVLQFMGVHCGTGGPLDVALVMEHVHAELDQCLRAHPNMDLSIKLSVLFDVSCGLLYLHSRDPPVVHRNLTASNVVLTRDLTAKVADLRMSKVFDLETQMSRLPEGLVYMPPEAFARPPQYDVKMDVFSFGVLCLFVANESFVASSSSEPTYSGSPSSDSAWPLESATRDYTLEKIGGKHPLLAIITQCLQEKADVRPSMAELNESLQKLCLQNQRKFKDMLKSIVDLEARKGVKGLRAQLQEKKEELSKLEKRLVIIDSEVSQLEGRKEIVTKNREKRKAQTLTPAREHTKNHSESEVHFSLIQHMQDKLRLAEEEKRQMQLEMQKKADSLKYEANFSRQELALKTVECDLLRSRMLQFEKTQDQTGRSEEGTVPLQGVKITIGHLKTPTHERKDEACTIGYLKTPTHERKDEACTIGYLKTPTHERKDEGCGSCAGLKKQVTELTSKVEKYQDECIAYQEQSTEQKSQIQFHADAHFSLMEKNAQLKKSLELEEKKVEELSATIRDLRKEVNDIGRTLAQEKLKQQTLELKYANMELVNDTLRQENLILFNQNEEMKSKISSKTLNVCRTPNHSGLSGQRKDCLDCVAPNHLNQSEILIPEQTVTIVLSSHKTTDISCEVDTTSSNSSSYENH